MDETTGEGVKLAVTKESASEASGSCRVLTRLEARFRRFRWDATRSAKLRQGATSSFVFALVASGVPCVSALSKFRRAPADGMLRGFCRRATALRAYFGIYTSSEQVDTHRPQSSSFLGFVFRIL